MVPNSDTLKHEVSENRRDIDEHWKIFNGDGTKNNPGLISRVDRVENTAARTEMWLSRICWWVAAGVVTGFLSLLTFIAKVAWVKVGF